MGFCTGCWTASIPAPMPGACLRPLSRPLFPLPSPPKVQKQLAHSQAQQHLFRGRCYRSAPARQQLIPTIYTWAPLVGTPVWTSLLNTSPLGATKYLNQTFNWKPLKLPRGKAEHSQLICDKLTVAFEPQMAFLSCILKRKESETCPNPCSPRCDIHQISQCGPKFNNNNYFYIE